MHFPRFPGKNFINQNMTNADFKLNFSNLRRLHFNLLLAGDLMRDLHRVKFTGNERDVSPLDWKIRTLLYQCLRSYHL